jgi:hypothetical protein
MVGKRQTKTALQNFETPFLIFETPLLRAETAPRFPEVLSVNSVNSARTATKK